MRTTLNIDDEILEAARSIARKRSLSVGVVLSDLARLGLRPVTTSLRTHKGFPVFDVSRDGTVLTLDCVRRYEYEP